MQRLRFLVWKEFLELRMEPKLFGIVVVAPILQLTMLGYAATTDVLDVPLVVTDADRSSASRELIERFEASRNFTVIGTVSTVHDVEPYLERGRAWLALSIPTGYGADVAQGLPVTLQVIVDGSDSNSTTVALGWAYGSYRFDSYKSVSPAKAPAARARLVAPDVADLTHALRLASATAFARDLINTPACDMTPARLASEAVGCTRLPQR